MSLYLFQSGTPLLGAAPPTEAEQAWWAEACRPFRRRARLMGIPPGLGVALVPWLLADPAEFLAGGWMYALPIAAVMSVLSGVLVWRGQATALFQTQLAGKRVRERLLAGHSVQPAQPVDDLSTAIHTLDGAADLRDP